MELTNDQYVTIGIIAEESIKQQEKICGYAHIRKSGNGYANIGKFIFDRVPLLLVHGATLGPIPTEDETKGLYVGVPGVVPHPVKEGLNNGHCPTCGADVTQPDIPYAHKSVAGNIMPGHTDTEVPKEDYLSRLEKNWHSALNHLLFSYPQILKVFPMVPEKVRGLIDTTIKEARKVNQKNAVPEQIKDLLWHDDEYESKDKDVNDRLIEAFRRGKGCK